MPLDQYEQNLVDLGVDPASIPAPDVEAAATVEEAAPADEALHPDTVVQ
jgi:hypothetical protein